MKKLDKASFEKMLNEIYNEALKDTSIAELEQKTEVICLSYCPKPTNIFIGELLFFARALRNCTFSLSVLNTLNNNNVNLDFASSNLVKQAS